jgi:hypothetical protein
VDTTAPTVDKPYIYNAAGGAYADAGFGPYTNDSFTGFRSNSYDYTSGPGGVEIAYCVTVQVVIDQTCGAWQSWGQHYLTSSTSRHIYYDSGEFYGTNHYYKHFCVRAYDNAGNLSASKCSSGQNNPYYGAYNTYMADQYQGYGNPYYIRGDAVNSPDGAWASFHGAGYIRIWGGTPTCSNLDQAQPTLAAGFAVQAGSCGAARPKTQCPTGSGLVNTAPINAMSSRTWIRVPYGPTAYHYISMGAFYQNAVSCSTNTNTSTGPKGSVLYYAGGSTYGQWHEHQIYPAGMNTNARKTWVFFKVASNVDAIDIDDTWTGQQGAGG